VYDLLEIGAGGGSIARINDLGLIEVGPTSAGSVPGPACYGSGGEYPTVTDADLVLGNLNAQYFLGGEMKLNVAAAERAIEERLAKPAGLSLVEAAFGVYQLVNENMAAAARIYIAEKGKVAAHLTLVSSGGAGPVHALDLARKLGIPRVVVPPHSGVMSSIGLLTAPLAFERSRAINSLLDATDPVTIGSVFEELERAAAALLPAGGELIVERSIELRYSGQDYALEIPVAHGTEGDARGRWKADFLAAYEAQYGTVDNDNSVELAAVRILVKRPLAPPDIVGAHRHPDANPKETRKVFIANLASITEVPVYERSALGIRQSINGPAVIEERESTTVVGSGDVVRVDEHGCLVVTVSLPPIARLEADTAPPREKAEA
jgi:N-methylhydantoinase A/oxoprolinase/acetone carboxylase beta subunit